MLDHNMVVVGNHVPIVAYCGLVVEIQIHLSARIEVSAPQNQRQPRYSVQACVELFGSMPPSGH